MNADLDLEWPEEPDFAACGFINGEQVAEFRRQSAEKFIKKLAQLEQSGSPIDELVNAQLKKVPSTNAPAVYYLGKALKCEPSLSFETYITLWHWHTTAINHALDLHIYETLVKSIQPHADTLKDCLKDQKTPEE